MPRMLNSATPSYAYQASKGRRAQDAGRISAHHRRIRVNTRNRGQENKEDEPEFEVVHSDILKGYDPSQYTRYAGINLDGGINLTQAVTPAGTEYMALYGFTGMGGIPGRSIDIYA